MYIGKSRAEGVIGAPPSKSMAHRHIICAALSKGASVVSNIDYSQDIEATLDCIRALGAKVDVNGSEVTITGIADKPGAAVDFMCRESGSTMRFFMGIAMLFGCPSRFFGSETLRNRPFGIYEDICKNQGIVFERKEDHIYLEGKLSAGVYELAGNVSSQFITGLMFGLPLLEKDSLIKLIPPVESRSYIDLTISALSAAGVKACWKSETEIEIPGNQQYKASDIAVEGDYSNAAFLDAFNYLGGEVEVTGLSDSSLQGDRMYKKFFPELKAGKAKIDISDCPDLGPVLFAVAAANNGGYFTGTARLKIKESNRGQVMCEELAKFGVDSVLGENDIEIKKSELHAPTTDTEGHNDHRIVMSMALLLSVTSGVINGDKAVTKSYPGFFEDIKSLGIEVK